MSLTIVKNLPDIIRVHDTNLNTIRITTNQYYQSNFNFIIRLYQSTTLINTLYFKPDSNGGVNFNPSSILKSHLTPTLDNSNDVDECTSSMKTFSITCSESYGASPIEYNLTTIKSFSGFIGCQTYEGIVYTDYLIQSGSTGHFLSSVNEVYLDPSDYLWLYFITTGSSLPTHLDVTIYTGTTSYTELVSITVTPGMWKVSIGKDNNSFTLPATWAKYTVQLISYDGDPVPVKTIFSEVFTVYRKDLCLKYDDTQLMFLNPHGGYSTLHFNKKKTNGYKIERKVYDKFLNYDYYTYNTRGLNNNQNIIDETITLNSDWLTENENTLMKELIFSTDVRICSGATFTPVVVLDTEFVEQTKINNKVIQYSIKIKKATEKIIQNF